MLVKELVNLIKEMESQKKELLQAICLLRDEDYNSSLKGYKTITDYINSSLKGHKTITDYITCNATLNTLMNTELRDIIKKGENNES